MVFDDVRIYGDGINVAARLENIAEPGLQAGPLRDHLCSVSPVTRNAEIDPGDNDPPPKMTQGVITPLTPLHHLQQHL